MNSASGKKFIIYSSIFSLLMFCYILVRAMNFSFTDDEASSVLDILYMNVGYFFGSYANTHLINTFFLCLEMKITGFSELSLRIHSVISYLVFAWFVYRFALYSTRVYLRYLVVILLTLNPFMLDYFSMARGYSTSFACMMAGLYYFSRYMVVASVKKKHLYLGFFLSGLSVISCYVMLNFYLALLCIYFFYSLFKLPGSFVFKNIMKVFWEERFLWLINILFVIVIMILLIKIGPSTLIGGWPAKSFWGDTLYSIVSHFNIYDNPYTFLIYCFFLLFVLIALIVSLFDLYLTRQLKLHSFFSVVFFLIYLSYTLQYHIFNIPFVSKRGIIYMYPIIMLMIFFSFSELNFPSKLQKIFTSSLCFISVWLVFNFCFNFSIKRGILTPPNDVEEIMKLIESTKSIDSTISIGVNASVSAPLCYYKIKNNFTWANDIGSGYSKKMGEYLFYGKVLTKTGYYDYFIIDRNELADVKTFQKIKIIKEYPATNLILAKAE